MSAYPLYFDYNATTPCDPAVLEAMLPYFHTHFGNAASKTHAYGWIAAEAVEMAREQIATLIGAEPPEIIFTSGATESINLALQGAVQRFAGSRNHLITVATEHKAVLDTCAFLQKKYAIEITLLPVDANGQVDLGQLEGAIRPSTLLIAAMYANNETGIIFPVKDIGAIAQKHDVLFFCDATQAVGKIPVHVLNDNIHLMAFSAHKMYGPKGVGALYVRRKHPRVSLVPILYGGGHENNMRSGTLNVPGIVGFGKAASLCAENMAIEATRLSMLRNQLTEGLLSHPGVMQNGDTIHRLPHVANLAFNFEGGQNLLGRINKKIAVATGSACTSADTHPSHVLKAMGLSDAAAAASIRFSLGRFTTDEDVRQALQLISAAITDIKS